MEVLTKTIEFEYITSESHLNSTLWTADCLTVVGEEVESLVGVDHQVRARSALRQVAMKLGYFLRSIFALMLELLCLRN